MTIQEAAENEMMAAEDPLSKRVAAEPDSKAAAEEDGYYQPPELAKKPSIVGSDGLNESFGDEEWEGPKNRCADLVFKIAVQNTLKEPIFVKFMLTEKQGAQKPINIKWPRTGIAATLDGEESSVIGLIMKIDPSVEEFGEIEKLVFDLKWKHDLEKIAERKPALKDEKISAEGTKKTVTVNEDPVTVEPYTGTTTTAVGTDFNAADYAATDDKSCPVCTYLNPATSSLCAMCYTQF